MKTDNLLTKSSDLPLTNSDAIADTSKPTYSVLPFFGVINMIISCGWTSYKAYNNGDFVMVMFVTFVFFATFSLDYCFRQIRNIPPSEESPRKHRLKVAIWVLLSTIMFGFACEFSTFMSLTESIIFFGIVIVGNTLLFYVYFIWDEKKSSSDCLNDSEKKIKDSSFTSEKGNEEEHRPLMETVDNV